MTPDPRACSRSAPVSDLLVVTAPAVPDLPRLAAVDAEVTAIRRHLPAATVHSRPDAVRAEALELLNRHPAVHFACHGRQEPYRPSRGGVLLRDGVLTVLDVAAAHPDDAAFAYLSACHTGAGSTMLADEAIHLAAAFQLTGYRHVVATLWAVRDDSAATTADRIYGFLGRGGRLDLDRTAEAVHHATRTLWKDDPYTPSRWAPCVHYGP